MSEILLDPFWVFDKVVETINCIIKLRDSTRENRQRCGYLVNRIEAIKEILEEPSNQAQFRVITPPKCMVNLQRAVDECKAFIEKYCLKKSFSSFVKAFGIESDFIKLNTALTDAQTDFNAYLASVGSASASTIIPLPPPPTEQEFEKDIMQAVLGDQDALLIIRVNPFYEKEIALFENFELKQPNLHVLYTKSLEHTKSLLCAYRQLPFETRVRIITNRTIIKNGAEESGAGIELIRYIRASIRGGNNIPVLIYTNPQACQDLKASNLRQELGNLFISPAAEDFDRFALFSTVLWVDPNPDTDNIMFEASENCVSLVKLPSTSAGFQYLNQNIHFRAFPRNFRIITNRARPAEVQGAPFNENAAYDFISLVRNMGFTCPITVYTSTQALPKVLYLPTSFSRVRVTAMSDEVRDFVKMVPLPDDPLPPVVKPPTKLQNQLSFPAFPAFPAPHPNTEYSMRFLGLSCSDLAPKDWGGTSDPYCVISNGRNKVTTPTIYKTLNPVWLVAQDLQHCTTQDTITLEVWDYDMFGKHDFEGTCSFRLAAYTPNTRVELELPLSQRPGHSSKITGTLKIVFILQDKFQAKECQQWMAPTK